MDTEEKRRFIIDCTFAALVLLLIYLGIRYVVVWLLPLLIGLIVARLLQRPIAALTRRFGGGRKLFATVLTLLLVAAVIAVFAAAIYGIVHALFSFIGALPELYTSYGSGYIETLNGKLHALLALAPAELEIQLDGLMSSLSDSLQESLAELSGGALSWAAARAAKMPELLISIIVSVIACFYVSLSYDECISFIKRVLPRRVSDAFGSVSNAFSSMAWSVLRSYLIVMLITFAELSLGFAVFGVDYAVALAAIIAVVDLMPILGVGTVLIPWGIACLVLGKLRLGIELLLLYVVVAVVRNTVEPKLIGSRIGLHPLLTLVLMYAGLKAVGFWGMFLFPLIAIILVGLQETGGIKLTIYGDE